MSKKQKSFYLEEDILAHIVDYQKEHKLSSPNVALERIILERMYNIQPIPKIKNVVENSQPNKVSNKTLASIKTSMKD